MAVAGLRRQWTTCRGPEPVLLHLRRWRVSKGLGGMAATVGAKSPGLKGTRLVAVARPCYAHSSQRLTGGGLRSGIYPSPSPQPRAQVLSPGSGVP